MSILAQYLLRRFGLAVLAVVGGLTLVAWALQVVRTAPEVLTDATPWPATLRVVLLPVVPIAAFVLPVAFAGGLLVGGRAARTEGVLDALAGCGVAPRRIAQPLLGLTLVATAGATALSLVAEPLAFRALADDIPTLAAAMLEGRVVPGALVSTGPRIDVYVERRAGDRFENVLVVHRSPEGSTELAARELTTGTSEAGTVLRLRDGLLRREASDGVVTATFAELLQPYGDDGLRERIGAMLPAGLSAGPAAPFDPRVLASIAPRDGYLLIRRWAPPLQCLLFGLLAVCLVLGRRSPGWNAVVVVGVAFLTHAGLRLTEPMVAVGQMEPVVAVLVAHLPAALVLATAVTARHLTIRRTGWRRIPDPSPRGSDPPEVRVCPT